VDHNRQWFKSCLGLPQRDALRDVSFCGHAILGDEIFVIEDASQDERFADNPR
jgi:GAF domain-containing protein